MGKLTNKCKEILDCDKARIVQPNETLFLIIGYEKNTKDNKEQWYKNEEPIDFNYTEEHAVASGRTKEELIKSTKHYAELQNMSWENYLEQQLE